jgi:hypothetical protein
MNRKLVSVCVLWLQIILFAASTVYLVWAFTQVIQAGAGFVPGFESIQFWRLVASLAPYLIVPVSIVVSFLLHRRGKYRAAAWSPLALVGCAFIAGRLYLMAVPDPIMENFGSRSTPYPGFLVLPPERVPAGFEEKSHHYTKREYRVQFAKIVNGKRVDLEISESDITKFIHDKSKLVQEFTYQGISGHVYTSYDEKLQKITLNLIWLNPPKQRISIYLTQTPDAGYSPDDLIRILASMNAI